MASKKHKRTKSLEKWLEKKQEEANKPMTLKDFAKKLDRKELHTFPEKKDIDLAKASNIAICFGYSDDLLELDGAMYDEAGVWNGGTVYVDESGIVNKEKSKYYIEARWCKETTGYNGYDECLPWSYETNIPYFESFMILENGEAYCAGFVFYADFRAADGPTADLSPAMKKRFCKDNNLPISVFDEPYFMERLRCLDTVPGYEHVLEKYDLFAEETKEFASDQDYFEYYNSVKENIIQHIKNNHSYQRFNEDPDVMKAKIVIQPQKRNLYSENNNGKYFVSIDMVKANFSALWNYDPTIFDGKNTWKFFIASFTDKKHIINSKYIRQVIMGALNPKRQMVYEKKLMTDLLEHILTADPDDIWKPKTPELVKNMDKHLFSLTNDEIIFIAESAEEAEVLSVYIRELVDLYSLLSFYDNERRVIPFRISAFLLEKISFADGFVKKDLRGNILKFKCVNSEIFHQVTKAYFGKEITDNDLVFRHDHRLAKYLEPVITKTNNV